MDSLFLSAVLLLSAVRVPPLAVARFLRLGWSRAIGLGCTGFRPDDDLGAVPKLIGAIDDDTLAGREAGKNLHTIAFGYAKLHRPHRHRAVGVDEVDEGAGRAALDARGRDRRDVLVGIEQEADVHELVRVQ